MKLASDAACRAANRFELRGRNSVYHRANRKKILARKTVARAGRSEYTLPHVYQFATLR
jgi:hypothetical protein